MDYSARREVILCAAHGLTAYAALGYRRSTFLVTMCPVRIERCVAENLQDLCSSV